MNKDDIVLMMHSYCPVCGKAMPNTHCHGCGVREGNLHNDGCPYMKAAWFSRTFNNKEESDDRGTRNTDS